MQRQMAGLPVLEGLHCGFSAARSSFGGVQVGPLDCVPVAECVNVRPFQSLFCGCVCVARVLAKIRQGCEGYGLACCGFDVNKYAFHCRFLSDVMTDKRRFSAATSSRVNCSGFRSGAACAGFTFTG